MLDKEEFEKIIKSIETVPIQEPSYPMFKFVYKKYPQYFHQDDKGNLRCFGKKVFIMPEERIDSGYCYIIPNKGRK